MKYLSPAQQAAFNVRVWRLVRQVPPGRVITYGQVAALLPPPPGVEAQDYAAWGAVWVGNALAACPDDVPWQRVINAQGKISLRPSAGGQRQRQLLEAEGVEFDWRGRVDLKHYGWAGPSEGE